MYYRMSIKSVPTRKEFAGRSKILAGYKSEK